MANAILLQMDQGSRERVERTLREIAETYVPQAGARALNRAALAGQTAMVKAVAERLGIKQAEVKPFIRMHKATASRLQANVYAFGKKGIPLVKLGPTGPEPSLGKGSGVRLSAWQGVTFPHAFLATMRRSGHRGVFERKGKARLPIRELFTQPIPIIFRAVRSVGVARAKEALTTNLVSEIRYALQRRSA
jgi:hypothetical protein